MTTTYAQHQSSSPHVVQALTLAETSSQALHNLYKAYKAIDDRYSLPYLCRKAKISSNGYLSDILHSKRRLPTKYSAGIIRAFDLKGPPARYLRMLIAIDNEKNKERATRLRSKVPMLRKAMTVTHREVALELPLFFFSLEVFCAFGLFQNKPRLSDLQGYFTSRSLREIDQAITLLKAMDLVQDEDGCLALSSTQVDFSGNNISQIEYLKMAFQHGAKNVAQWFEKRDHAVFESINVSVKKSMLPEKLELLRQTAEDMRFTLESDDADMLVRLNLQVYPLS